MTTTTDCGVCSLPWHLFKLGIDDITFSVITNLCRPVKNTLGGSVVVFCACEIIQFFFFFPHVVRAVYKFDFRLVIYEKTCCINGHMFLTGSVMFYLDHRRDYVGTTGAVKVVCILLST